MKGRTKAKPTIENNWAMNMTKRVERHGEVSSVSRPVLSFAVGVMLGFPFKGRKCRRNDLVCQLNNYHKIWDVNCVCCGLKDLHICQVTRFAYFTKKQRLTPYQNTTQGSF